jgi:HKD family nuclease/predicted DNA-binding protein YlxM (UPF0122 family)
MEQLRGVLTDAGLAIVVSVPRDFNLHRELSRAQRILLATAFARTSGWKYLKHDIVSSSATTLLLTGLDFQQTEPSLLRDWHRLSNRHSRIEAKLASRNSIFHPKVLIVKAKAPRKSFAIVGSGNLTSGGLLTNTECALYANNRSVVNALELWFEGCWKKGKDIKLKAIKAYEPSFEKARKALQLARKNQRHIQSKIEEITDEEDGKKEATLKLLKKAVKEFNAYSKRPEFRSEYRLRRDAVTSLQKLLHTSGFDFKNEEFAEFYKAPQLGGLRERWLREILKRPARLKSGLRYLVDEDVPIEKRVNSFLERRGHHLIPGFKIAGVSKVLAVIYPDRWPVLNNPVRKALSYFQYEAPRGSPGERYRQFAELARKFEAPDFLALDAFFKHKEGELKRSGD